MLFKLLGIVLQMFYSQLLLLKTFILLDIDTLSLLIRLVLYAYIRNNSCHTLYFTIDF